MWSLLDGAGSGSQYAARAVELGQPALALTDHGVLSGMLEHMMACSKAGIMPICGVEAYFRENRLIHQKENLPRWHITLLAMNYTGWLNLMRMTSESHATGFYNNPCIDWDLMQRYNEGIYCLLGCIGSRFSSLVSAGWSTEVHNYLVRMRSIWGDRLSFELQPHDFDNMRQLNTDTINTAYQYGIPLAATGDTHYPWKNWAETQELMLMIRTRQSNLKRAKKIEVGEGEDIYTMRQDNPTLYLMSEVEMMHAFATWHPHIPSDIIDTSIAHTGEIVSRFEPFLLDRDIKMPRLTHELIGKITEQPADETQDPDEIVFQRLRQWAYEGLEKLKALYPAAHWLKYPVAQYEHQIEYELGVFRSIGVHVTRYMLMVAGEVRWARRENVVVGPGRGSAAGSLVAYCIEITDIDPISYNLMFERFINLNRKGMPDIDIDFMPGVKGRDKVKVHTASIYGADNVIDISTFNKYGPKAAIRAVCRVFDDKIDYQTADRYAKVLDRVKVTDNWDLQECRENFPEIEDFAKKYPMLWEQALRIEDHPFTMSEHASGVIVKPPHVDMPVSLRIDRDTRERSLVTAWSDSHEQLANYGFLKIDYLVINGLVRQFEIMEALREREGTPIDLRTLPVRWDPEACDPGVMENFARARVLGVWQMTGKGTIPVLKGIKPTNMHDLAAINALIRPAARGAGMTDEYARRKNGQSPITYWHDAVEEPLRRTLGLMIYQEQMMEIAVQLGDFTRTEADDLRKAMGKKYRDGKAAVVKFLNELGYGEKFIHNASFKVGEQMAREIWENKCIEFGGYSFNASHAYAYSLISYHDMLLKTLAPADFYAWLLTFTKTKELPSELSAVMREGSRFDIRIAPPDINKSEGGFTVTDLQTILFGLLAVTGVGPAGYDAIIKNRPFRNLDDFRERVPKRLVNKNGLKALAGSGAMDSFGMRSMMTDIEKQAHEEATMGFKISGKSQSDIYGDLIEATIHTEDEFDAASDGEQLCVGGEITGVKPTVTKKRGDPMGFVNIVYGPDSYRVTLFPPTWALFNSLLVTGNIVFFEGRKDISEQYGEGFIAEQAMTLDELVAVRAREHADNPFMKAAA